MLAASADYACAVRAVSDVRIRVGLILNREERSESRKRIGVGKNLHVLNDVAAKSEVAVRRVYAAVVNDYGEVAGARNSIAAVGERERAVLAEAIDAREDTRLVH